MGRIRNTVPLLQCNCYVEGCLLVDSLLSIGCFIVAYFAVDTQQRVHIQDMNIYTLFCTSCSLLVGEMNILDEFAKRNERHS
jgi:hypothetical protein